MKKIFISMLAAASVLTACNKDYVGDNTVNGTDRKDAERVQVVVNASAPLTRATSADEASESQINKLEVLVFREDGIIDGYGKAATGSVSVSCTKGTRDIYAVVNSDTDLSQITTVDELLATKSYLKNNSRISGKGFVMIGSLEDQIFNSSSSFTVPVRRLASRVWVKKISKAFDSPALQSKEFKVIDIFLINVVNQNNFAGNLTIDGAVGFWYNRLDYQEENKADKDEMTYISAASLGSAGVISASASLDAGYALYGYPNPCDTKSEEATWSARNTKWVLKCSLDGKIGYVHFMLPAMEANKSYEVDNLIINHRPTDTPWENFEALDTSVQVTVDDWDLVKLGTGSNGIVNF